MTHQQGPGGTSSRFEDANLRRLLRSAGQVQWLEPPQVGAEAGLSFAGRSYTYAEKPSTSLDALVGSDRASARAAQRSQLRGSHGSSNASQPLGFPGIDSYTAPFHDSAPSTGGIGISTGLALSAPPPPSGTTSTTAHTSASAAPTPGIIPHPSSLSHGSSSEDRTLLVPAGITSPLGSPSPDSIRISRPKIFYAARTHTQVSQVVHELQSASGYRPRIAVLASRDRLCVHKKHQELSGKPLQRACLRMQNEGKDTAAGAYAADQSAHRRLKFSKCPAARQLSSFLEMYGGTPKVFQVARAVSIGQGGRRRLLLPEDVGTEAGDGGAAGGRDGRFRAARGGADSRQWGAAGALAAAAMRGGVTSAGDRSDSGSELQSLFGAPSVLDPAEDEMGGEGGGGTNFFAARPRKLAVVVGRTGLGTGEGSMEVNELSSAGSGADSATKGKGGARRQLAADAIDDGVMDIEDMKEAGKKSGFCPFYFSRQPSTLEQADLVLMPYSYLLDPSVRASIPGLQEHLRGAIVIVDEAHNIDKTCSEAASFDLAGYLMVECVEELRVATERALGLAGKAVDPTTGKAGNKVDLNAITEKAADTPIMVQLPNQTAAEVTPNQLFGLQQSLVLFSKWVQSHNFEGKQDSQKFTVYKGATIVQQLAKAGLSLEGYHFNDRNERQGTQANALEAAIVLCGDARSASLFAAGSDMMNSKNSDQTDTPLEQLRDMLDKVFVLGGLMTAFMQEYRVVIRPESETRHSGVGAASRSDGFNQVSFWCFRSHVAMRQLQELGVRSVVLTSGTLSPMRALQHDLGIPFEVRLTNPHVVRKDALSVSVLGSGPGGIGLSSSFTRRSDPAYLRDLGRSIAQLASTVSPDGALVFFSSYGQLNASVQAWQTHDRGAVWRMLNQNRTVVVEPRSAGEMDDAMKSYEEALTAGRSAIIFAVCRGKIAEGINFGDNRGRLAIVTGIPYPSLHDTWVQVKRRFLDEHRAMSQREAALAKARDAGACGPLVGSLPPSGSEWYSQQGMRAVNQAIGRVVRHKDDWASVVLADERFGASKVSDDLSSWLQPFVQRPLPSTSGGSLSLSNGRQNGTRSIKRAYPEVFAATRGFVLRNRQHSSQRSSGKGVPLFGRTESGHPGRPEDDADQREAARLQKMKTVEEAQQKKEQAETRRAVDAHRAKQQQGGPRDLEELLRGSGPSSASAAEVSLPSLSMPSQVKPSGSPKPGAVDAFGIALAKPSQSHGLRPVGRTLHEDATTPVAGSHTPPVDGEDADGDVGIDGNEGDEASEAGSEDELEGAPAATLRRLPSSESDDVAYDHDRDVDVNGSTAADRMSQDRQVVSIARTGSIPRRPPVAPPRAQHRLGEGTGARKGGSAAAAGAHSTGAEVDPLTKMKLVQDMLACFRALLSPNSSDSPEISDCLQRRYGHFKLVLRSLSKSDLTDHAKPDGSGSGRGERNSSKASHVRELMLVVGVISGILPPVAIPSGDKYGKIRSELAEEPADVLSSRLGTLKDRGQALRLFSEYLSLGTPGGTGEVQTQVKHIGRLAAVYWKSRRATLPNTQQARAPLSESNGVDTITSQSSSQALHLYDSTLKRGRHGHAGIDPGLPSQEVKPPPTSITSHMVMASQRSRSRAGSSRSLDAGIVDLDAMEDERTTKRLRTNAKRHEAIQRAIATEQSLQPCTPEGQPPLPGEVATGQHRGRPGRSTIPTSKPGLQQRPTVSQGTQQSAARQMSSSQSLERVKLSGKSRRSVALFSAAGGGTTGFGVGRSAGSNRSIRPVAGVSHAGAGASLGLRRDLVTGRVMRQHAPLDRGAAHRGNNFQYSQTSAGSVDIPALSGRLSVAASSGSGSGSGSGSVPGRGSSSSGDGGIDVTDRGDSCPICMSSYASLSARGVRRMKARRCGHACCAECWKGWMRMKIECPLCKQTVRPQQLEEAGNE